MPVSILPIRTRARERQVLTLERLIEQISEISATECSLR